MNIEFSKLENVEDVVGQCTKCITNMQAYKFALSCTPEQSHRSIEEKSTLDTTTLAILAENGKALEVNEAEKERDVAVLSTLYIVPKLHCAFNKRASFDHFLFLI